MIILADDTVQWHPAFAAALKLELKEYYPRIIRIEEEHQLSSKPLEIDILIIKKDPRARILKNIGRIFKEHNVVEYKSPDDYLSIDDYYKVKAYAYLYKSLGTQVDDIKIETLTVTMVSNGFPRNLVEHVKELRKVEIKTFSEGIYYFIGEDIATQLIIIDELPANINRYLRLLSKKSNVKEEIAAFVAEYSEDAKNNEFELLLDTVWSIHFNEMMEVFEMAKELTAEEEKRLEKLVERFNLPSKWQEYGRMEGRMEGKMEGKMEGRMEGRMEVALNLLRLGMEISKIIEVTGLSEEEVKKLMHLH